MTSEEDRGDLEDSARFFEAIGLCIGILLVIGAAIWAWRVLNAF